MLRIKTHKPRSLSYYLAEVRKLLANNSGTIEKAILPTVFDIYSYPHEPVEKIHSTKAKRS